MSTPAKGQQPRSTPDGEAAVEDHYRDPVLLEEDETIPPRPEEEIADLLRAEPS